jgi:hypothetical protein
MLNRLTRKSFRAMTSRVRGGITPKSQYVLTGEFALERSHDRSRRPVDQADNHRLCGGVHEGVVVDEQDACRSGHAGHGRWAHSRNSPAAVICWSSWPPTRRDPFGQTDQAGPAAGDSRPGGTAIA